MPRDGSYLAHQGRLVVLAVRGDSPQVLWEYVVGSHVPGPIVSAADGTLRAHAGDGFLHAVTPEGKQLWSPAHVGEPLGWAAPVVNAAGGTWVSAYDGGLIDVDTEGKCRAAAASARGRSSTRPASCTTACSTSAAKRATSSRVWRWPSPSSSISGTTPPSRATPAAISTPRRR